MKVRGIMTINDQVINTKCTIAINRLCLRASQEAGERTFYLRGIVTAQAELKRLEIVLRHKI